MERSDDDVSLDRLWFVLRLVCTRETCKEIKAELSRFYDRVQSLLRVNLFCDR